MEKFTIVLLSTIFIILITGSVQYVTADHVEEFGQGIFKDEHNMNSAFSKDSKYQINLHVIVRNAQDQLVSVSEVQHGYYLSHQLTDQIIDEMQPGDNLSKEIIIIDKMKYEKIQQVFTSAVQQYSFKKSFRDVQSFWGVEYCIKTNEHGNEQGISCIPIFQTITPHISLGEYDIFTLHWTILREIN